MKPSIEESKREDLLHLIEKIEDKIDSTYSLIENCSAVSDGEWAKIDDHFESIYSQTRELKKEVIYS